VPDRHHPQRLTKKKLTKNKVQNSGIFLDAEKRPSTLHDLPATHHNFTTKTPRKNTHFFQNPLKKRPSHHTTKKMRPGKKPNRIVNLKSSSLTLQRE
jgi:hypothetical protein